MPPAIPSRTSMRRPSGRSTLPPLPSWSGWAFISMRSPTLPARASRAATISDTGGVRSISVSARQRRPVWGDGGLSFPGTSMPFWRRKTPGRSVRTRGRPVPRKNGSPWRCGSGRGWTAPPWKRPVRGMTPERCSSGQPSGTAGALHRHRAHHCPHPEGFLVEGSLIPFLLWG